MNHPALLIIDIQKDYFPSGNMALEGPDTAAAQAARLLGTFRQRHWPRYIIQHESVRPGSTFLVPGTPGQAIHEMVAPRSDETVITKHYPNAFQATPLHETLRGAGVRNLVVCGMMTHMCIDTSVRAAFELGYRVQLVADATATRALRYGTREVAAEAVQAAFLAALQGVFAEVLDTDTWLGRQAEAETASGEK